MTETRKIFAACGASLGVHLLLFLLMVLWLRFSPELVLSPEIPEPQPVEMILEPEVLKALQPPPTPPPARAMVDSEGLAKADAPPENPLFESDIDSRAAGALEPSGAAPLPSQEGKERPFPDFENKTATEGDVDSPPGVASLPVPAVRPEPVQEMARLEQSEPKVEPKSAVTPQPVPEATPEPTPEATPQPTPEVTPESAMEGILPRPTPRAVPAGFSPTAAPTATPAPTPTATPPPNQSDLAMLRPTPRPMTRPSTPSKPGYQRHAEQTRIEGSISNRGPAGVDAVGTPIGRYRKAIADAIGSRWYHYVNKRIDLITVGSVRIRFFINSQGRAENVEILSNSSNSAFAEFSVLSITEAKIPPLPAEVAPLLDDNRLEIQYTFTIYPN